MKKCFIIAMFATILLTGCVKNSATVKTYKTVNDYEKAYMNVQKQYHAMHFEGNQGNDIKFSVYIKGNKWREKYTQIINGKSYYFDIIKNDTGTYVLTHNGYKNAREMRTIIYPLLNWYNSNGIKGIGIKKSFLDNNANINGINCRKIQYRSHISHIKLENEPVDATIDACISDKYGVAVFYSVNFTNEKASQIDWIEIKKIEVDDIPDSMFEIESKLSVPHQLT